MTAEDLIKRSEILQAELEVINRITLRATSMEDVLEAIIEEQQRNTRTMQQLKDDSAQFFLTSMKNNDNEQPNC